MIAKYISKPFLLILLLIVQPTVYACSCANQKWTDIDIQEHFCQADAVFIAKVLESELVSNYHVIYRLAVVNKLRGEVSDIAVTNPSNPAECGFPFRQGDDYLVFAYFKEQTTVYFSAYLCGLTARTEGLKYLERIYQLRDSQKEICAQNFRVLRANDRETTYRNLYNNTKDRLLEKN